MAGGGPRPRAAPVVDGEREFPQEAVSPTPPAPGGTAAPGQVEEFDVDPMLDNFRASLGRG